LTPVGQAITVKRKIEENQATSRTNQPWLRWTGNYNYVAQFIKDIFAYFC